MKLLLLLTLLIGAAFVYRAKFAGGGDGIEGRWTIVSVPDGWKKVPGTDVMVTGNEIQIRLGKVVTTKMTYTHDPSNCTVDATTAGGAIQRGIYRAEDDMLTLCLGAEGKPRPESPDSTAGGAMKWVLQRATHP